LNSLSAEELFREAGLFSSGAATWPEKISESGPGVYVISIADLADIQFDERFETKRCYWNPHQEIIYIGRARRLSRRLHQFYGHKHGNRSPHRGGQDILLLHCPKMIQWAVVDDHADAERCLLEAFERAVGQKPFGNRVPSARISVPRA
jgi:hypothetical protein